MTPDWILVANATHARLLQKEEGSALVALRSFEHRASRAKPSDLGDAPAGRELSGHGFGGSAFERHTDAHRKELQAFAHQLGKMLEEAAQAGQFHRLVIVSSSPFLGELRGALGHGARGRLAGSHDADLTAQGLDALESRLGQWLPAGH